MAEPVETDISMDYKKLQPKRYPPRGERETPEGKFWRSFRSPSNLQQIAAVTSIDFCTTSPFNFAVTSSTRVIVYDCATRKSKRVFSRFRDVAYSGTFRSDGQLIVAGGETGIVQVFDAGSRSLLRQFKGHKRPVHFTRYAKDKIHVLSAGDDATVRWWDVAAQEAVSVMTEHSDYVRCGAASPSNSDLWATGSYDHTVRLWDLRSGKSIMKLQHDLPVEAVLFFPSGGLLATTGGNHVNIWDVLGGGRLLQRLSNHQKTVTAITLAAPITVGPANRTPSPRLLTGSADCHVKVYDLDNFRVSHAVRYPAPVLSLGISANASTLAVGMSTGLLSIRHRKMAPSKPMRRGIIPSGLPGDKPRRRPVRARPLTASSFRYFIRGRSEKAAAEDFLVAQRKRAHLGPHDRFLRKFQYSDALTAALKNGRPEVVMAVLDELVARGGLKIAINDMNEASLGALLGFLIKNIANPRHSRFLVPLVNFVLDLFASSVGSSASIDYQIGLLKERVLLEVRVLEAMAAIRGMLQPLLQGSVV